MITDFFIYHQSVPMGNFFKHQDEDETSLSSTPIIEIQPDRNSFSFEFAALDYTNPSKNRFEFKLEGFDKDWIKPPANQRLTTYTGLI